MNALLLALLLSADTAGVVSTGTVSVTEGPVVTLAVDASGCLLCCESLRKLEACLDPVRPGELSYEICTQGKDGRAKEVKRKICWPDPKLCEMARDFADFLRRYHPELTNQFQRRALLVEKTAREAGCP
jgi:hypothetical protein